MFGFHAFASAAFNSLLNAITPPTPVTWGKTGQSLVKIQLALQASFIATEVQQQLSNSLLPNLKVSTQDMGNGWQLLAVSGKV